MGDDAGGGVGIGAVDERLLYLGPLIAARVALRGLCVPAVVHIRNRLRVVKARISVSQSPYKDSGIACDDELYNRGR
jgi:hypothetical protein